jgi:hypothetical protein
MVDVSMTTRVCTQQLVANEGSRYCIFVFQEGKQTKTIFNRIQ